MDRSNVDLRWVDKFIKEVRRYLFVREEDSLLIIVPNQAYKLNPTGLAVLKALLRGASIRQVINALGDQPDKCRDVHVFMCDVRAALCGCLREGDQRSAIQTVPFRLPFNTLPVLSEIAVTYRCNLRCDFCYAGCPRSAEGEMSTGEVYRVLEIIRHDAKVPSVSFTGGEPTLRDDLARLVRHAVKLDLRTNLITNGTLLDARRVRRLARAGLDSAQVSVEGPTPDVHDTLTHVSGSWTRTIDGIRNLQAAGIRVHANTTINRANIDHLEGMVELARRLELPRLSMNMMIPGQNDRACEPELRLRYVDKPEAVARVKAAARKAGIEFLWYSPTPYCIFNPVAEGLGNQGCAACDGLLSVSPTGDVLPCSSFHKGVGNLPAEGFRTVWQKRQATFWRHKEYAPDACRGCDSFELCQAACPLYWEAIGCEELELAGRAVNA